MAGFFGYCGSVYDAPTLRSHKRRVGKTALAVNKLVAPHRQSDCETISACHFGCWVDFGAVLGISRVCDTRVTPKAEFPWLQELFEFLVGISNPVPFPPPRRQNLAPTLTSMENRTLRRQGCAGICRQAFSKAKTSGHACLATLIAAGL
jgi:hypothetical protein